MYMQKEKFISIRSLKDFADKTFIGFHVLSNW